MFSNSEGNLRNTGRDRLLPGVGLRGSEEEPLTPVLKNGQDFRMWRRREQGGGGRAEGTKGETQAECGRGG